MKVKKIIKNSFVYKKMPESLKLKIKNIYKKSCNNVNIDPVTGFVVDDYYVDKMIDLEDKYNLLENNANLSSASMYLVKKKTSKIMAFFRYIRRLFIHNSLNNEEFENNNDFNK